jgi:hypothetical protein
VTLKPMLEQGVGKDERVAVACEHVGSVDQCLEGVARTLDFLIPTWAWAAWV